jgi:hypothetical protein
MSPSQIPANDAAPIALGTNLPGCEAKTYLTEDQGAALQEAPANSPAF